MTQLIDESTWLELNIDTLERRVAAIALVFKNLTDKQSGRSRTPVTITVSDIALVLQVELLADMDKIVNQNGSLEDCIYPLSKYSATIEINPLPETGLGFQFPEVPERINNLEEYFMWLVGLLIKANEKVTPAQPLLLHTWDWDTNSLQYHEVTNPDGSVIMQPERKEIVFSDILTQVQFNIAQPASLIVSISLPYDFRDFLLGGNLIAGIKSQIKTIE